MNVNRRMVVGGLLGCALQSHANSPPFPSKAITLIVPFGAGSGGDQAARVLAPEIAALAKVPVVINNVPGGNGALAFSALRNAPADGHTVMLATSTTQVINQILMARPPFDPGRDLMPVTGLTKLYQVMVVRSELPVQDVAQFIARAKSQPGKVMFGSGTAASRLGAELFNSLAGIELTHIPYKATPNAVTELAGGQIDMMFVDLPVALPLIHSGRLRALAVGAPKRLPALQSVPTLQEAGIKGYEYSVWSGLYVLAGTPGAVVNRLYELGSAGNRAPASQKFREGASLEIFEATPAELARFQATELASWKETAAKLRIKPE